MIILGVETSCDETSAAICLKQDNRVQILSNVVASSADLQAKYGGVIPEQAAREQLKSIIPVISEALSQAFPSVIPAPAKGWSTSGGKAGIYKNDVSWIPDQVRNDVIEKIDAIAVTQGPGLIGSLLVGVETAKTLSLVWNKPLVPVNHLIGHFYANWIGVETRVKNLESRNNTSGLSTLATSHYPTFPCLGLLVSGGHTDLVLFTGHGKYKYLGGTRDDASGECFDKCARLLGLPYPGGPVISKLAKSGNPKAFKLPRPMLDSGDWDFSFSGLKTAVANLINNSAGDAEERSRASTAVGLLAHEDAPEIPERQDPHISNLAASIEAAIVDVLVKKTLTAAQTYHVDQIIIAGGVAANQRLSEQLNLETRLKIPHVKLFIPPPNLCTDNAAYIAAAAFFNYHPIDPLTLQANPNLSLS